MCGACPWCKLQGVYIHKKVTYPCAVMYLPPEDPLREQYKREFKDVPAYRDLHDKGPPEKMTLAQCRQSATRVQEAKTTGSRADYENAKKENPYLDFDIFSEKFPGYDKLKGTLVDPYHEFSNVCDDMRALIFNVEKTGQYWSKSRRLDEQKYGRFQNMGKDAGWHVKAECIARVRRLLRTLKVPIGWPDVSDFCVQRKKKKTYMKIAERLAIFGYRGLYILGI